jgi:hypothetical protein
MKKLLVTVAMCAGLYFAVFTQAQSVASSHDKNCMVTVPAGWSVDAIFGLANAPDKKNSVTVSNNKSSKTIADLKGILPMVYPGGSFSGETATELWMTGKTPNGMHMLTYHALKGTTGICISEFDYDDPAMAATAKSVLGTLKAK